MRRITCVTWALVGIVACNVSAVTIETVPVGDVGNAADTNGLGAVDYAYSIGTYGVTVGQYAEYLNTLRKRPGRVCYSDDMSPQISRVETGNPDDPIIYSIVPGRENEPVAGVSFWNACAFANWLSNGQGQADTETGSYTLNGYDGSDASGFARNPGATWVVASMDEWHKAAYYAGGSDGTYFTLPTPSAYGMVDGTGPEWTDTVYTDGTPRGVCIQGKCFSHISVI